MLSCTKIKYKTRALLRVNLRGAFFRTKKYIPAVNFCKTVNLILEEMDENYKPITSMKEVSEQLRKLRRQYLRYQQAEIIYSISHKKLFELASDDRNGLDYVLVGDYYLPMIDLPDETRPIGHWGMLRKEYMKNYKSGI